MSRFMRKGTTKFYWATAIADPTAPTVAEMGAAVDLSVEVAEITGFEYTNSPIDTPDLSTAFVSKIPGEDAVGDSSLAFYEDDTTNPIRTALTKGTVGFVVIFPTGIAGAAPADTEEGEVWPAIVASSSRQYSAGNEAAKYMVTFTLTDPPSDATVTT